MEEKYTIIVTFKKSFLQTVGEKTFIGLSSYEITNNNVLILRSAKYTMIYMGDVWFSVEIIQQ